MVEGDDEINPTMRNCMNGFKMEEQEDQNSQEEEEIPLFSKSDEF